MNRRVESFVVYGAMLFVLVVGVVAAFIKPQPTRTEHDGHFYLVFRESGLFSSSQVVAHDPECPRCK